MLNIKFSRLLAVVLIVAVGAVAGWAKDKAPRSVSAKSPADKAFAKTKKEFQQRIRNKNGHERAAALQLLEEYPTPDAADLVYVTLLDDRAPEVRQAAVAFLAALRDKPDITDKLIRRCTTATQKDGMDRRAVELLRALGGSADEKLQKQVLAYLNEFLGTSRADQFLLHAMIDEPAGQEDAEVLRMLLLFTQTKLFGKHYGFRRCVVQGIIENKEKDSITHLINLLPEFKGQVQFDVISHLIAVTGQNFRDDAAKWKAWWFENQANPKKNDGPPPPVGDAGGFGQYYGIPICAKRVVFVLDTSGSMRGGKLDSAKAELVRAIRDLPKEVAFSLVIFNSEVRVWQRELVPASEQMKQIAVNVVLEQSARQNTASYDALEAAFALEPEAIYFLSDGAPEGGKTDIPSEILSDLSSTNRVRRISIHSIGIATKDPTSLFFERFMRALADNNWGEFRSVD